MAKSNSDGTGTVPKTSFEDFEPSFVQDSSKKPTKLIGAGIYDLDYFNGSQCALYIGDVYIDEAVSLNFTVSQSKQPIYGYASQLFDGVSYGNVIVQGTFAVNFKESGYLWLVLQRYKRFENATNIIVERYQNVKDKYTAAGVALHSIDPGLNPNRRRLGGKNNPFARIVDDKNREHDFISRAGIERLVSGEASKTERFKFYQDLAGYATVSQGKGARDKAFEDIVEVFEDKVWQEDVSDLDDLTRRVDDNFFDNFDMFIVYGDYTKPGANHTVRRIRGVHLLSTGQQIQVGADSIFEEYQWLARTII